MPKPLRVAVAAVVALLVTLGLTACGPDHGVVHDKQHTDAYTFVHEQCTSTGKSTICYPVVTYVPPSWELDVYASKDDHGWVEVTEATYERYSIGDRVDFRSR